MARSRLPLRGIAVFSAISRLGSFKAAAAELNLSPSALSHQIRALEEELGVQLFKRRGRGVVLSSDAARYAETLTDLFERMQRATADIAAPGWDQASKSIVRIMTPPSIAAHWLVPRLPAFIKAHPNIDLRLSAIRTADGNTEDFDITIRYGDAARWKGSARPLLKEVMQPYCAPLLLGRRKAVTATTLLSLPLIQSRENAVSWETWFRQREIGFDPAGLHLLQIDPSYVAIEAAANGVGVILESSLLTAKYLERGQLVAPVRETQSPAPAYWLMPLRKGVRSPVQTVHTWLIEQARHPRQA
jgi:LysR family glycine cleavage system transcriptional activator